MKKLVLLSLLGALGINYAQAQTPLQKTKSLITLFTETWCPPCGAYGHPGSDAVINGLDNGNKGYLLTVRISSAPSTLNATGGNSIGTNYNPTGVPTYYLLTSQDFGAYTTATATATPILSAVNVYNGNPTVVSAAANYKFTGNRLDVGAKAKFWSATSGDYYMSVFVVEEKLSAVQKMSGGPDQTIVLHPNLRGGMATSGTAFASTPWGVQIGSGAIAANTTVSKNYTWELTSAYVKANLKYYVVIYKKNGAIYEFVNIEEAKPGPVSVQDIAGLEEATLFPNPVTHGDANFNITLKQAATMNINVTDINGRVVYSSNNMKFNAGSNMVTIPTQNLANGTYTVNLIADGKSNYAQQLVIAK